MGRAAQKAIAVGKEYNKCNIGERYANDRRTVGDTTRSHSELKVFLSSFCRIHIGWKLLGKITAILGTVNIVAWYVPELFGYERYEMLLPSAFVFPAVWLFMIFFGGGVVPNIM